jgi:thioredoxin reductase
VARDERGFTVTGDDVPAAQWQLERSPLAFETSLPRVFAVGAVHRYLANAVTSLPASDD